MKIFLLLILTLHFRFCIGQSITNTVYSNLFSDNNFNANAIDLSKPVGVLKGEANVAQSGSAVYSIPIIIPPGTNGVQPNIGISYNSQSGNGVLGYGWGMAATSVITRGVKTNWKDAYPEGVNLNDQDAFYLDGKRLYLKNGTNSASGSEYYFESEDYSKVIIFASSAAGPGAFVLYTKEGGIMEYSARFGGNVQGQMKHYSWYLNRVTDPNGNAIEYFYDYDDQEIYLSRIEYTKNSAAGLLSYNTVYFHYSKRLDPNTIYDAGIEFRQTLLLDNIEIKGEGGQAFKKYLFSYGFDGTYSFLKEAKEQGTDGSELNSTIFKYGNEVENLAYTSSLLGNVQTNGGKDIFNGDFDGDGVMDLLVHSYYRDVNSGQNPYPKVYTGFSIWKRNPNTGNWYQSSPTISTPGNYEFNEQPYTVNSFQANDFNGDGRSDILMVKTNYQQQGNKDVEYYKIYYPNETATAFTTETIYPMNITTGLPTGNFIGSGNNQGFNYITVGDFDGDGKSDFITVLSNYAGFNNFYIRPSTSNVVTRVANPYHPNPNYDGLWVKDTEGKLYGIEMNGDGKTELMVVNNSTTNIYEVINNPGNATKPFKFNLISSDGYPTKWHEIVQFGDFNGDQKTDLITKVTSNGYTEIAMNNGIKWIGNQIVLNHAWNPSCDEIHTGEFNGDGKTDYIHIHHSTNYSSNLVDLDYYFSRGKSFNYKTISTSAFYMNCNKSLYPGQRYFIGDYTGDGREDILNTDHYYADPDVLFTYGQNVNNFLLNKVKDGYGYTDEFIYNRLNSGNSFYTKNLSSSYPLNIVGVPTWLVYQHNSPDGVGGTNTSYYQYQNFKIHRGGRGALGFGKTISFNPILNTKSETEYTLNSMYYINNPQLVESYRYDNNELLTQSTSTYQYSPLSNNRFKMELTNTDVFDVRMNTHVKTDYIYDNYSNPLKVTKYSLPLLYKEETTVPSYIVVGGLVPTKPISSKVYKQRFTNNGGSTTMETGYSYDAKGNLIQKTEYVGLPKALTTTYQYNNFGNIISETISSAGLNPRVQKFYFDNKNRFVIRKERPCPTCTGSPTLTEYYTYSPLWGSLTYYKDANCQSQSTSYDPFGREKSITNNLGIVSTTSYAWNMTGNTIFQKTMITPDAPYDKTNFDLLGRSLAHYAQGLNGSMIQSFINFNNKGQKVSESNEYFSSESPLLTNFTYDAYNRLTQVSDFQGNTTTSYTYLSYKLKTITTLPDGRTNEQITDASGVTISSKDKGGELTYTYTANGEIRNAYKSGTLVLSNLFDQYNKKTQAYEPNAGTVNYVYNAYGEMIKQTDNNGHLHENTYDGLGRVTKIIGPEGTTSYEYGCHFISYVINAALNSEKLTSAETVLSRDIKYEPIEPALRGCCAQVLKKITGFNGIEQEFYYDDYIRTIEKKELIDGQSYSTKYSYNIKGQLEKTIYPSTVEITNIYDNYGNVKEKRDQNNQLITRLNQTNGMGQVKSITQGDGSNIIFTYSNGFPQQTYAYNNATGGDIIKMQYLFNFASGNLAQRKDMLWNHNQTENFTYDNLNRLTSAQVLGQAMVNYQFDQPSATSTKGNVMQKSDIGKFGYTPTKINAIRKAYNAGSNAIPPNVISTIPQQIEYTPFEMVSKIKEGDYKNELVYSPQLERVRSVKSFKDAIKETKYYFEGCERLINANGDKWITYVNGANGITSIIVSENGQHKNYYTYTDHLGSIIAVTNSQGNKVVEQNFDAWGRRRDPTSWQPIATNSTSGKDWLYRGYTGHEHIDEFSLINMNARLYDPVIGRMLSPDNVLANPYSTQDYNKYSYASNNPMCYVDPDGNIAWFVPIIIGAAIGAYSGGAIANGGDLTPWNTGKGNDKSWDFSSGKTWGYMLGGAIVGGASGALGGAIATSGIPFANTISIATSSFVNSLGTNIYTGGATGVSISFGIASYDITNKEWGYFCKKGNKWYENLGYVMGGLANVQDAIAGLNGNDLDVKSRPKLTGHSEINGTYDNKDILISVGPNGDPYPNLYGMKWEKEFFKLQLKGTPYPGENVSYIKPNQPAIHTRLNNVNGNLMLKWTNKLNNGYKLLGKHKLTYGLNSGCVNYTSRALFYSGVFNVNAFLPLTSPVLLNVELGLRNIGIFSSPYLFNLSK